MKLRSYVKNFLLEENKEARPIDVEKPLRAQVYTRDQLAELAAVLAEQETTVAAEGRSVELKARFRENCKILEDAYYALADAARNQEPLSPGAEWLLDNFHIVEQHIRDVKKFFPSGYDQTLPKFRSGEWSGFPRVYRLALEVVTHSDALIDTDLLTAFISSYQNKVPLTSGELWAVPIMLKFALIENLRRLISAIIESRNERVLADHILEQVFGEHEESGADLLLTFAKKVGERPSLLAARSGHLIRKLREKGMKAVMALQWLEGKLSERGIASDQLIRDDYQRQALDQISIGNSITSLKSIGTIDWSEWFEQMSTVEVILRKDPSGIYPECDFNTRDLYRHQIEQLSRWGKVSELTVSEAVIKIAEKKAASEPSGLAGHIGYFLIGKGRSLFEEDLKIKPPFLIEIARIAKNNALALYLTSIGSGTFLLVLAALSYGFHHGASFGILLLIALFYTLPASDLASSIVQWCTTHLVPATLLAKLSLKKGVPDSLRTLVVVHGIFEKLETLDKLIDSLEVRFLGNDDPNIYFALLADFKDSESETTAFDDVLMKRGAERINELNNKYPSAGTAKFTIMFRKRQWNPQENMWMAWERKRGKLEELNGLILGKEESSFIISDAFKTFLRTIRYVITLDGDSQLPKGSGVRLIGTIAHPLNKAVLDSATQCVSEGYGIIQPRVGVSLTSANVSFFSKIFSGHSGLDPYTQTVSDVYQDIFNEASFVGKGIYDVAAFDGALKNRVPENSLLSHDLFEGIFTRTGLVSDIELYDEFPSRYTVYSKRQHRWVRGDWQLLPWLLNTVEYKGASPPRSLSALGRWKIIDNLRRSLLGPSLMVFLLLAWTILPGSTFSWCVLAVLGVAFPLYTNIAHAFIIPPIGLSLSIYVRGLGHDILRHSQQAVLAFTFLAHHAALMVHAIITTLYRTFVSKKHLLEWETAYNSERRLTNSLSSSIYYMFASPVIAAGVLIIIYITSPERSLYALPFITAWFIAPWVAAILGASPKEGDYILSKDERAFLQKVAFDTWKYFRDNMNAENNFLVPDNVQFVPHKVTAHRTSPTNIGLSLLSTLAAYDLGFTTLFDVLDRSEEVFKSLAKLERFHGHFLNWYETTSLNSLRPRYVSTVDSGNLIGYLYAVKQGFLHFENLPIVPQGVSAGGFTVLTEWYDEVIRLTENPLPDLTHPIIDSLKAIKSGGALTFEKFRKIANHFADLKRLGASSEGLTKASQNVLEALQKFDAQVKFVTEACIQYTLEADFKFLLDPNKNLLIVGYNVDESRRDNSSYDLLASEARLPSLVGIAKGDLTLRHWFSLGRGLADTPGGKALLSWSGTMFEYLMPLIVMKDYPGTLLSETYRSVVSAQQKYASRRGVPWGISESAFSGVDLHSTYQYRAFGVPQLGLKRGLENDLVISPYSTQLALPIAPKAAIENLHQLSREGAYGEYGYFEAIDYTPERLNADETKHVVQACFAHHQGMGLVSIANLLDGGEMQERFHSDPAIKSVELLLHERFPQRVTLAIPHQASFTFLEQSAEAEEESKTRMINTPHTTFPLTHLLTNGAITSMADNAGSGFLLFEREVSLTRWREDKAVNNSGYYLLLRDRDTKEVWSSTYQPTRARPDGYQVFFSADKIEYKLKKSKILTHTEITVASDDNVEVRRVTLSNLSSKKRSIEITSYAEVVLGNTKGDASHQAFAKMFIESEFIQDLDTLIFSRRPRSADEPPLFMFHAVSSTLVWERTQFETSRAAFIGRGNTIYNPRALRTDKLEGNQGFVLDPIFSLRIRVDLEPHQSHTLSFVTGAGRTRDEVRQMASRYQDFHQVSRAFNLAWSQSSVELRNQQFPLRHTHAFQLLGNALIFSIKSLRATDEVLSSNRLVQAGLWRFGISGDLPIILVHVNEPSQTKFVRDLLNAHWYLSNRGLIFDLVIINEHPGGYFQNFQEELDNLLRSGPCASVVEKRGGVFLRTGLQLSPEEIGLLQTVARVVLHAANGTLEAQLSSELIEIVESSDDSGEIRPVPSPRTPITQSNIQGEFATKYGSFTGDGNTYAINVHGEDITPMPWSNIIANEDFGTLITESGSGYTWSANSRENRLTPWSNDPVSDTSGEAIYIKDVESGAVWCPTPRPIVTSLPYKVEHAQGVSRFETEALNIKSKLSITVAPDDKVKWWHLALQNTSTETKTISVYFYVEWVLGVLRSDSARFICTEFDKISEALVAVNRYNNEFAGRYGFIGSSLDIDGFTADRDEFIGRNRDLTSPLALISDSAGKRGVKKNVNRLLGKTGAGLDPCGVLKVSLTLDPRTTREVTFFLGEADSLDQVRSNTPKNRSPRTCLRAIDDSQKYWADLNSVLTVKTPSRSFDILLNGWLLYQTVSCRLFGRTGFYQSGGAYGFRDQLQDVLALLAVRPDLAKKQILLHASRQFVEGDVQHWWHPPTGRGVRTKISDDYLWLPYVVDRYIEVTGDLSILEETVSYIEGAPLNDRHEAYIVPHESTRRESVYNHCLLSLEHGLTFGAHGLPLIGCGDWNDGMNEVGKDGKGESVWLAWFLAMQLNNFVRFVEPRDAERAQRYKALVKTITQAIEKDGWDGKWYRRAYFDDGTPLGSALNDECRIDSISQTWGIISGLAENERSKQALEEVYHHLVKENDRIICLLTPPFNKSSLEPGYIKGYLPGVRENGGQYTHAGVWVVIATALLGRGSRAFELYELMNPVNHTSSDAGAAKYMAEPYVMCGDVYGVDPHVGRGGWSWYSGSAGWLYQAGLEYILGLKVRGDHIQFDPCIPAAWPNFHIVYKFKGTEYRIEVLNPDRVERGVKEVRLENRILQDKILPLNADGGIVKVQVVLGS
jgi:cyclic beta-1,2-glucan synthetase